MRRLTSFIAPLVLALGASACTHTPEPVTRAPMPCDPSGLSTSGQFVAERKVVVRQWDSGAARPLRVIEPGTRFGADVQGGCDPWTFVRLGDGTEGFVFGRPFRTVQIF